LLASILTRAIPVFPWAQAKSLKRKEPFDKSAIVCVELEKIIKSRFCLTGKICFDEKSRIPNLILLRQ